MQIQTHSPEETEAVGRKLAAQLQPGDVLAYYGDLGAGKTAFCQGIAEGLGCTDPVSSPTFAIVNYYRGPRPFAHFDLYRIHTEGDVFHQNEVEQSTYNFEYADVDFLFTCFEQYEKEAQQLLALENPIKIHIERVDETTRKITIQ